jgi:hypothetical protein
LLNEIELGLLISINLARDVLSATRGYCFSGAISDSCFLTFRDRTEIEMILFSSATLLASTIPHADA